MSRAARLSLQDEAKRLLPWDKVTDCYRLPKRDVSRVTFSRKENGKVKLSGLARCGSVWICPVCSNIISSKRRTELTEAIERAKKLGLNIAFLTLTVRHNKGELARDLLQKVSKARRLLYNRKPWKRISKELDIKGSIRALEVNYNYKNGWHIHTHELIFYKSKEIEYQNIKDVDLPALIAMKENKRFEDIARLPIQSRLLIEWFSSCETAGLQLPDAHGVTVQPGHLAGRYASKWGLAEEMTSSEAKVSTAGGWRETRKGFTPWQLLSFSKQGDEEAGRRFVEYAEAFRGRRQLVWSKGLDDLLSVVPIADDQQILDLEDKVSPEVLGSLPMDIWGDICGKRRRAEVIEAAERWGWCGVEGFILHEFSESFEADRIRRRLEEEPEDWASILDGKPEVAEQAPSWCQPKLAV